MHPEPQDVSRFPAIVALLAVWLSATALQAAGGGAATKEPMFVPRVLDVRIEGVSLERIDVSMQMAVRASRNVTIRTLRFSDGFIDRIPVRVTPLDGRWPLRRGEEFVIPSRIAVTAYARDALGAASLAELIGRTNVDARAVVEMSFDTPWVARMLRTATDVAVTEVAFKAPVPSTPLLQPLARLGAGVLEFLQRQAAPGSAAGPTGQPPAATCSSASADRWPPWRPVRDRRRSGARTPDGQDARPLVDAVDPLHDARSPRAVALQRRRRLAVAGRGGTAPRRWHHAADSLGLRDVDRDRRPRAATAVAGTAPSPRLLAGHRRAAPHAAGGADRTVGTALPACRRRAGPRRPDGQQPGAGGRVRRRGIARAGLDRDGGGGRTAAHLAHAGPPAVDRLAARDGQRCRGTRRVARRGLGRARACRCRGASPARRARISGWSSSGTPPRRSCAATARNSPSPCSDRG